jgi:opacity protein-like surface antigen
MNRSGLHSACMRWLAAAAASLTLASAQAAPPAYDGEWHYTVTPYLWLPNVNGNFKYSLPPGSGSSAESEVGPNSYLENLQGVLMLSGEARRNEWAVIGDLIYLDFGNQESHVTSVGGSGISVPRERNLGTSTDLKGWTWMLAGSYTTWRNDSASVDLMAGVRLLHMEAGLNWNLDASIPGSGFTFERSGSVERSDTVLDAIIGVRGRVWFGNDKWFVPYHLDVGGGESSLTWQALAGVGYAFAWGEVQLSWRELAYEMSGDKLLQDIRFSGPALGLSWRF